MNFSFVNQGIEVVCVVFSIQNGKIVTYLTENNNGSFLLPNGEIYNNESCEKGVNRVLNDTYNINSIDYVDQFHTFSDPYRSMFKRMIAVGYIVVSNDDNLTSWYDMNNLPPLGLDHKNILIKALDSLKRVLMLMLFHVEVMLICIFQK